MKENNGEDGDEPQPIDLGYVGAIAGDTPKRCQGYSLQAIFLQGDSTQRSANR
jgi:hypothetical protein